MSGNKGDFKGLPVTSLRKLKNPRTVAVSGFRAILMVRPAGIEPAHPAPEAGALSPELRARNRCQMQEVRCRTLQEFAARIHAYVISHKLLTITPSHGSWPVDIGRGTSRPRYNSIISESEAESKFTPAPLSCRWFPPQNRPCPPRRRRGRSPPLVRQSAPA